MMETDLFNKFGVTPDPKQSTLPVSDGDTSADLFQKFGVKPDTNYGRPQRTALGTLGDVGVTALKGAVGLPQGLVGLADIPTGGRVGKFLEDTAGYRPQETQEYLDTLYSPAQQAANRRVSEAKGFLGTARAALENPSTILTAAGESLPSMIGGAGLARGFLKAGQRIAPRVMERIGEKTAPVLAGALGEGAMGAGAAAEQMRAENQEGTLSGKQSLAAVGSGAGTALFGFVGGRLAQRFGFGDVDTLLAQGSGKAVNTVLGETEKQSRGFLRKLIGSGISEGVFEELPQSAQEQMWQNYATSKPLLEGVGEQAAMGMLAGGLMGLAGGGYQALRESGQRLTFPLK